MHSTWLTIRMHRFEVLFVIVLMGLTAVSALIAASSAEAVTPPVACQQEWYETGAWMERISQPCRRELRTFFPATDSASFIREPIAIALPWLLGIVLGVPLVGRELESGTASLAWSLNGRRVRWLLARVVPMLLLLIVGASILAFLLGHMADAAEPFNHQTWPGRRPELGDIGREGLPFVTRTAAAFGVGLLVGALVGRTLTAFVIAVVLSLVLSLGLDFGLQRMVAEQVAQPTQYTGDDDRAYNIMSLGTLGYRQRDGSILSPSEVEELWVTEICPDCGDRFAPNPAGERIMNRYDEWFFGTFERIYRTVPTEAYPTFVRADILAGLILAGGSLLLTVVVVSRRRPR